MMSEVFMPSSNISRRKQNQAEAIATIRQAVDKWPSSFVARSQISKFTGGLLAAGTAANADSAGVGIKGAFRVGRQIAYPVAAVADYLISRLEA